MARTRRSPRRPMIGMPNPDIPRKTLYEFESWNDLVDKTEHGPVDEATKGFDRYFRWSRRPDMLDWYGNASFEQALHMARYGWSEGAQLIAAERDSLYAHLAEIVNRKEIAYAPVGPGILNLKRYGMGHPAPYMVRRETSDHVEIERNRGILRIGFNISASASIATETMFRRGAAVCALIDCLERARFRVELDIAQSVHGGYPTVTWQARTRLKRAEDHLEPDLLAFVCAHAASFRRICFSLMEQESKAYRDYFGITRNDGYGSPTPAFTGQDYDVVLEHASGYDDRWQSPESAARWVRDTLAAQGVEVLD